MSGIEDMHPAYARALHAQRVAALRGCDDRTAGMLAGGARPPRPTARASWLRRLRMRLVAPRGATARRSPERVV